MLNGEIDIRKLSDHHNLDETYHNQDVYHCLSLRYWSYHVVLNTKVVGIFNFHWTIHLETKFCFDHNIVLLCRQGQTVSVFISLCSKNELNMKWLSSEIIQLLLFYLLTTIRRLNSIVDHCIVYIIIPYWTYILL